MTARRASLPMYNLPGMQSANRAFWDAVRTKLFARGLDAEDIELDAARRAVPDGIGPEVLFTQICGYPLFKHFSGQGVLLATPCYAMPGCEGPNHSAFFMVRAEEPATELSAFRGRVFGCNSLKSNSGMNLPRVSLARIAQGRRFFKSVVMTEGHPQSLDRLVAGTIDLCSIDCVTWGFVERFNPDLAQRVRVLEPTVQSPALPFVTSVATPHAQVDMLRHALDDVFADSDTKPIRDALALAGIAHLPDGAYAMLADYEREAAALGYPEIA